jgi:FdhD protein
MPNSGADAPRDEAPQTPTVRAPIERWNGASALPGDDLLAVEEPLEIRIGGRSVAVVMRTPGDDPALAAGFLFSEGILRTAEDLLAVSWCGTGDDPESRNVVEATLAPSVDVDERHFSRRFFASSACGVCGKAAIDFLSSEIRPIENAFRLPVEALYRLEATLRPSQAVFTETGGLHAAALFDGDGALVDLAEDVGRHNAVDKLVGRAFFDERLPLSGRVLLVSGRASFEIVLKAFLAGIPVLAAVGAPSSLAVSLAGSTGLTLAAFLRGERVNLYAGAERITGTRG